MKQENEIIVYQPDASFSLEVRIDDETVWLNRSQIVALFDRDVKTIGKHINNALKEELQGLPTVANFATVQIESLKDLGKKLFAFIKMETSPDYT